LGRSSVLILVATPAALERDNVYTEVVTFSKRSRPIVPIDMVGGVATLARDHRLYPLLEERIRVSEPRDADGKMAADPSKAVMDFLIAAFGFVKVGWIKRLSLVALAAIVIALGASIALGVVLWQTSQTRSGELLGTRAQQLAQQPLSSETAAVIPAAAAYGWRRGRSADAWNALQSLIWSGVSRPIAHDGDVQAVAFSPNNALIATASIDGKIRLARTADGVVQQDWPIDERRSWANVVAFTSDSGRIAAGGGLGGLLGDEKPYGRARLFAVENPSPLWDVVTAAPVHIVAIDPLDRFVAIGTDDGTARLLDLTTGKSVAQLPSDRGPVRALAFSRDGKLLAAGSQAGKVRVVATDRPNNEPLLYDYGDDAEVYALKFSPADDELLAVALSDGTVRVGSASEGGGRFTTFKHDGGIVNSIALSPDGAMIATAGYDHTLRIFDIENQREVYRLDHAQAVESVAFSPDGRFILAGGADKVAQIVSVSDRKVRTAIAHNDEITVAAFSGDGRLFATGGGHFAQIFPLIDGFGEEARIPSTLPMRAIAFSADGRLVAAGGDDGTTIVRSIDGSGMQGKFNAGGVVGGVAFSPNSEFLAMWAHRASPIEYREPC
jgi:WD40 repeat protein